MMTHILVNGLHYHYLDEGTGTPVVLLHGFPDTAHVWRYQVPALTQAGFRVIAPDLRGRGQTDKPEGVEAYRLNAVASDVAALMDALGVERAHIVGHDWGAATAWLFAMLHPQRVNHLVALSVGHPAAQGKPSRTALEQSWYRLLFDFPEIEPTLQYDDWYLIRTLFEGAKDVERYIEDLSQPGALTAALNWYRANLPAHRLVGPAPHLPLVTAPTMGVWSSGDRYLSEAAMLHSGDMVTGPWRYERIEDVDHWIPVGAPDALNRLLLEFLPK